MKGLEIMTRERQAEANRLNADDEHRTTDAGRQSCGRSQCREARAPKPREPRQGRKRARPRGLRETPPRAVGTSGRTQLLLADRIVSTAWRLRRAVAIEAALFKNEDEPHRAFNDYGREKMGVLSRYEVTLERSLDRALHELQRLQAARQGEVVPLPRVVDMEVSVSEPDEPDKMALFGKQAHC